MLKLKERNRIVEILTNPCVQFTGKQSKRKSTYTPSPIEQLIFNRNLLQVFGHQKTQQGRRNFNFSQLEINQSSSVEKYTPNLKRANSTKSNAQQNSPSKQEQFGQRCRTSNNRFFINNSRPKSKNQRIVEDKNESQRQRYEMLHLNFIKLSKQYQNIYGIPISEFLLEHKFLIEIHQELLILLLSSFKIDCTNIYEVVTFQKYKQFKQVVVWKDNTMQEQVNIICKIFENATGGELLNTIHLISMVQPYRMIGKERVQRNMDVINKTVYDIENKCIEYVLKQGNLNAVIDSNKFKDLFLNRTLDINLFINLLSGQF